MDRSIGPAGPAEAREQLERERFDGFTLSQLTGETVYGRQETAAVPISDLVVLTQVRDRRNPEAASLYESIKKQGLLNKIHIARLTRQAFVEYLAFVNEVWRAGHLPDEHPEGQDGYTYLVVAGHSRAAAIKDIEAEKVVVRQKHGLASPASAAKTEFVVYHEPSPRQVIAIQLHENIYRAPSLERKAMAIVETYLYGLKHGQWQNQNEFLRQNQHNFGRTVLADALHFSVLPPHIRDFVLLGGIPYRAGVELGRILPTYAQYVLANYFNNRLPSELEAGELSQLEHGILEWLGAEVAHLQNLRHKKKLSSAVIKGRYESYRRDFERRIAGISDQAAPALEGFAMADPLAEWRLVRRQRRSQYRRELAQLANAPLELAVNLTGMHLDLLKDVGKEPDEEAAETIIDTVKSQFLRRLGASGLAGKPVIPTS